MSIIVHPKYPELIGVRSVKLLTGFTVHVTFTNDTERDIDLEPYLWGPVFEPIRNDPKIFASIFVDPVGQTLAWPNDVDIAPETLYYGENPPWVLENKTIKTKSRQHATKSPKRSLTSRKVQVRTKAR